MHTAANNNTSPVPATSEQWARYNPMKSGNRPGFIQIDSVYYPHEREMGPTFKLCPSCGERKLADTVESTERALVICLCGFRVEAKTMKQAVARRNALAGYEGKAWFDKLEIFCPVSLLHWQLLNPGKLVPSIEEAAGIKVLGE